MTAALACSDCGAELRPNKRRKGTRCRACLVIFIARDPQIRAKATATLRETLKDPALLARRGRAIGRGMRRKIRLDADYAQRQREAGRRVGLSRAGPLANPAGSDARVRAGRSISKRKRQGIPAAYWDEYYRMVHSDHIPAAEARRLVIELQEKDRRDRLRPKDVRERQREMREAEDTRSATRKLGIAFARAAAKEQRA
jgi:hypothetical protein